jgi:hypothetical protein
MRSFPDPNGFDGGAFHHPVVDIFPISDEELARKSTAALIWC